MKLSPSRDSLLTFLLISTLSLTSTADAKVVAPNEYLSAGWQPGQTATRFIRPPRPTGVGGTWKLGNLIPGSQGAADVVANQRAAEPAYTPPGFLPSILSTLTSLTGNSFNFTAAYERVQKEETFDPEADVADGFVRLTGENWEELVVNEKFPAEDGVTEEERVWFIIVHGPPKDSMSNYFLDAVTNASYIIRNETIKAGGKAPGLARGTRLARVDYMGEGRLGAGWLLFKPPAIVISTNHGQTTRFLMPGMIAPNGTTISEFIKQGVYKEVPVWESAYAPGGGRRWVVDGYVFLSEGWGKITTKVPSWLFLILTTMLTQQIMQFMHRNDHKTAQAQAQAQAAAKQTPTSAQARAGPRIATAATSPGKPVGVTGEKGDVKITMKQTETGAATGKGKKGKK